MRALAIAAAAAAALGLAGCSASPPPDATISFAISSGDQPISAWRIGPDGNGVHISYPVAASPLQQTAVVKRFAAGADGYARIRLFLERAEAYGARVDADSGPDGGGAPPCDRRLADYPTGWLEWAAPTGTRFRMWIDHGCKSDRADAIERDLIGADNNIKDMAGPSPAEIVAAPAGMGGANDPLTAEPR